jgi:hypothetical protein
MSWTVNVAYPITGQFGIDGRCEAAVEEIAGRFGAPVTGSGSGLGMRDLDLEARDEDHARQVEAALLAGVPGARTGIRDDAEYQEFVADRGHLSLAAGRAAAAAASARAFILAHDAAAVGYDRQSKAALAAEIMRRRAAAGEITVSGGPWQWSKDELVAELTDMDYPLARVNAARRLYYGLTAATQRP